MVGWKIIWYLKGKKSSIEGFIVPLIAFLVIHIAPEIVNNLFLPWPFVKFCGDAWLASNLHCSSNLGSFISFLATCDNFSSKPLLDVTLASWESKCYLENMDVRNQARFQDKKITPMDIILLISAAIWTTRSATKGTMKPSIEDFFSLKKSYYFSSYQMILNPSNPLVPASLWLHKREFWWSYERAPWSYC